LDLGPFMALESRNLNATLVACLFSISGSCRKGAPWLMVLIDRRRRGAIAAGAF
jgi:hypothetical protein